VPDEHRARRGQLIWVREVVGAALWPIPAAATVLTIVAGIGLVQLDQHYDSALPSGIRGLLFGGGPGEARQLLAAIATGLITTVSLVFSLTIIAAQLASTQYSPRMLRELPRDGLVRATLAVLVGAFAFALTVLRTVRDRGEGSVPRIAVSVSFLLTMVAAVLLVIFLGHVVTMLRVETMLKQVHRTHDRTVGHLLADAHGAPDDDERGDDPPDDARLLVAVHSGFVNAVDEARLVAAAQRHGVVVRLLEPTGAPATAGIPLAAWWSSDGASGAEVDEQALARALDESVVIGYERTAAQDLGYGIQQMVDVYLRALSPAVNDPTTAVSSLGHLAAALVALAGKDLGPRRIRDSEDGVRLVVPLPGFADLLELALAPVRRHGMGDIAVATRVFTLLRAVAWVARDDGERAAVRTQLDRARAAAERELADPERCAAFDIDVAARRVEDALERRWR
jgi:uncharacterized membrane protein